MKATDFLEILFVVAIATVPVIRKYFRKDKPWKERIADLQFSHPEFFQAFPSLLHCDSHQEYEAETLKIGIVIRENVDLKEHISAYVGLSKIVFGY